MAAAVTYSIAFYEKEKSWRREDLRTGLSWEGCRMVLMDPKLQATHLMYATEEGVPLSQAWTWPRGGYDLVHDNTGQIALRKALTELHRKPDYNAKRETD